MELEYTFGNILVVMICVIIVYYLGYAKGYMNATIQKLQEHNYELEKILKSSDKTKSLINDKNAIRIFLEKIGDTFHIYEKSTNKYLGFCSNLLEMNELLEEIDSSKTWWISKEDLDRSEIE